MKIDVFEDLSSDRPLSVNIVLPPGVFGDWGGSRYLVDTSYDSVSQFSHSANITPPDELRRHLDAPPFPLTLSPSTSSDLPESLIIISESDAHVIVYITEEGTNGNTITKTRSSPNRLARKLGEKREFLASRRGRRRLANDD